MTLKLLKTNWIQAPDSSRIWISFPLVYTGFIQVLTGFPKPHLLRDRDFHHFLIMMSEEIFDYPFWMQDLSHFPLFFIFAWLWAWFFTRLNRNSFALYFAAIVSVSFAIINELIQFFIPDRFPSAGDILMNLLGVTIALVVHSYCRKTISSHHRL